MKLNSKIDFEGKTNTKNQVKSRSVKSANPYNKY